MKTLVKTAVPESCCANCYWCGYWHRNGEESLLVCMTDDWKWDWDAMYPVVNESHCCEHWLDADKK